MAKKKIYFGTNTKMYKTIKDTVEFVSQLQELTKDISRHAALCYPFLYNAERCE